VCVPCQDARNPLGVDPAAPLDVVIFKGGFGDDYAIYVNENMYQKLYPDAQITYAGDPASWRATATALRGRRSAGRDRQLRRGALDTAALVAEGHWPTWPT
jgi:hypothetical protein